MERLGLPGFLPQSGGMRDCLRADLLNNFSGINAGEFLYPFFLDEESIRGSLEHYIERLKNSGGLRERFMSELRPTAERPDPDAIVLMTYYHRGQKGNPPPFDHFYFDGEHSVLMFKGDPREGNGACVSFAVIAEPKYSEFAGRGIDPDTFKKNDLIIVQLQTATYRRSSLPHFPLHPFRWEIILTGIVAEWAKQVGFPRVLMQPAANNYYYNRHSQGYCVRDERNEILKRRYDGTAESFGFKRLNEKGPFILDFLTSSLLDSR